MTERLAFIWPEIALFIATCAVMVVGLSPTYAVRKSTAFIAAIGLVIAGILAATTTPTGGEVVRSGIASGQMLLPNMVMYAKVVVAIVGLLLLLPAAGTVDRADERDIASGRAAFNPLRSNRAEFYAFFLFSLTGLMLCASADDLIWLFLALELTSLPTYMMVAISRSGRVPADKAREAGVKYFFLGALGAAIFLYGFALIYGGTASTKLNVIADVFRTQGINDVALAGILIALLGLCFKIAAVPMHFYTADVYEGAAAQVSAFLAFVPKTAGFLAIMLLLGTVGWDHGPAGTSLPEPIRLTLWVVAALTMTVGNVLAVLQHSVKRMLAYSSIAHSGYMLVGVIAGPGPAREGFTHNGLAAVLFYLFAYGVMNLGTFAVLACLERGRFSNAGDEPVEIDTVDDLRGLCKTHPALGWTMVICALSLLGFPPLLGFFGKLPLFTAAISAGEIILVIVLGLNSAIAAFYYLRLVAMPLLENPDAHAQAPSPTPFLSRHASAVLSAVGVIVLGLTANTFMRESTHAANYMLKANPVVTGSPTMQPLAPASIMRSVEEMTRTRRPEGDVPKPKP